MPTFFIVGAPKAGTTAWYTYLASQPAVFLPREKELHHFSRDLLDPTNPVLRDDVYVSFFAGATAHHLVGQVAVFDLYSTVAAANIHAFCPTAKIIMMVRNPIDLMHSLHSQLVYNGHEDIADFRAALDAEAPRKAGRVPMPASPIRNVCLYRDVAHLSPQIERYFRYFPREQVHIVVFDDLQSRTERTFAATRSFLGLPPGPGIEFRQINSNKRVRSAWVRDTFLDSPPPWLRQAARVIPTAPRHGVMRLLLRSNTRYTSRPPMDPALRSELASEMAPEIDALSELIGRDLRHWYSDDRPGPRR